MRVDLARSIKTSFIVPAHNEAQCIGSTLAAIHKSAHGLDYEVLVVSDSSDDDTASIAAAAGARVLEVGFRQIAATRDAGARAAVGEVLFFVDADTRINPEVVSAALKALERGASGGGAIFRFDERLSRLASCLEWIAQWVSRLGRLSGGCFLFCTAAAYRASGGFNLKLFAGEELAWAHEMKKVGRFVIVPICVTTSARKLRAYSLWEILKALCNIVLRGPSSLRSRHALEIWYRRRPDPKAPSP